MFINFWVCSLTDHGALSNSLKKFAGALSFSANLCRWDRRVPDNAVTRSMFAATSCPRTEDPRTEDPRNGGPWCQSCWMVN